MKSSEDMARDIFKRRDEYIEKKKRTRRMIFCGVSPAVCGCLVIAMTMGLFVKADNNIEPQNTDEIATQTQIEEKDDKLSILENEDIIWADIPSMTNGFMHMNNRYGVTLCGDLYTMFEDLDDDQLIAVCASGTIRTDMRRNESGEVCYDRYYKELIEGVYYKHASGVHEYSDKYFQYTHFTIRELLDQGMSWPELIKSEQGIDYFMELYNDEYGTLNMAKETAKVLEKHFLEVRAEFEKLGFNVIYDGTDPEWGVYFSAYGGYSMCVVITTPRQLKELGETSEFAHSYSFRLAPKYPLIATKHIAFSDIYSDIPTNGYFIPLYPDQKIFDSSNPKGYLEGYNGNVDEFYELVLKERNGGVG